VSLTDELWLQNALEPYRVSLFTGITTHQERKEKARGAIRLHELATVKHKDKTFAEWFLATYREAL